MKKSCKNCNDFVKVIRKKYVLVHLYFETGFHSIVAFSDNFSELVDIAKSQPHFGSSHHFFGVINNYYPEECIILTDIKDEYLINICKNVATYLSFAEYSMLKKSFIKASSWFEKAKNSSSLGAVIIDNY